MGVGSKPDRSTDGSVLTRNKYAQTGWSFQLRAWEFQTSTLSSLKNDDSTGVDAGGVTVKFYDASDVELTTQLACDTSCVKTVIDFEPTHDYEAIGGGCRMSAPPVNDVRVWVIGVPDVPKVAGGSVDFVINANFKYLNNYQVNIDGRTSKRLNYDATSHTNKLRYILKHDAGAKLYITSWLEIFRP